MPLLTRDAILAVADRQFEDVPVPEWGGTVRVSTLSAAAVERLRDKLIGGGAAGTVRAAFVAASVVDEDGSPVFTAEDVDALARKSNAAMNRVHDAANRLNKLDVEAAAKN